ncbi:hypothetical protein N333_02446, partial [Nestor notabilis]
ESVLWLRSSSCAVRVVWGTSPLSSGTGGRLGGLSEPLARPAEGGQPWRMRHWGAELNPVSGTWS